MARRGGNLQKAAAHALVKIVAFGFDPIRPFGSFAQARPSDVNRKIEQQNQVG